MGGAGDVVGGSIGDLGVQLEKMLRSLEIAMICAL